MRTRVRAKMLLENAPHNILVDVNAEDQEKLLSDSAAAPARITSFGLDNGRDQLRRCPSSTLDTIRARLLGQVLAFL